MTTRLSRELAFRWVGDAYVQMLVNYAAGTQLARLLRRPRRDAAAHHFVGRRGDCFNIPDFALLILGIARYVEYTGDADIVAELWPAVAGPSPQFERHVMNGLLADVSTGSL
jgi:hypothetical protein